MVVAVRKPSSVPAPGRPSGGGNHSSRANVAVRFVSGQPRGSGRAALPSSRLAPAVVASLCGLAPDGVCRAVLVTEHAVGSYSTLSPLPRRRWSSRAGRFAFCCTFLEVTLTGHYPASCPMELGLSSRRAQSERDRRSPGLLRPGRYVTSTFLSQIAAGRDRSAGCDPGASGRRDFSPGRQVKYSSKTGCSASSSRRARNFFFARLSSWRARSRETPSRRPISASESSSSSSAIMRTSTM